MDKEFAKKFGEIITLSLLLITCASKNCTTQKNNVIANKDLVQKYNQYKLEQNKTKKVRLLGEINDTTIMYELNTCLFKNCKTLVKNIMTKLKLILRIVPKTSPKYEKMHLIVNEMNILIETSNLTEKQYKKHIKNINNVLASIE
jgi:hypothetical protein